MALRNPSRPRRRGEEYLLKRKLLRRKAPGENCRSCLATIFVSHSLEVRRAACLEYFRSVGDAPDRRMDEAINLLRSKQQIDGTWMLENTQPGKVRFVLEVGDGRPSQWTTLCALRVLRWYEQPASWAAISLCAMLSIY